LLGALACLIVIDCRMIGARDGVVLKLLKAIAGAMLLLAAVVIAGIVVPRPLWRSEAAESGAAGRAYRFLVLSNPIHTDLALPIDAETLARFAFLRDAGLDLDNPNVRYIVIGWGGRSFYTETPTWADLKPMPVLKSFTLDSSVMHVGLAGDIPLDHPAVKPISVSSEGRERLMGFVEGSFSGATGKPVSLGISYGMDDAFFEANGYFNALVGCNTWTAAALRQAGLTTGWWTALPPMLTLSLRLHGET
jgi:uncharacterized protein (TIGR02117 family)